MKVALANTHYAGELVSDLWESTAKSGVVDRKQVSDVVVTLRDALSAALALESRALGNPPPRSGD